MDFMNRLFRTTLLSLLFVTSLSLPVRTSRANSFHVSVDVTPPTLSLPGFTQVQASPPAVVTYSASAYDAVSGNMPVSCDRPSGSLFPMGVTTGTAAPVMQRVTLPQVALTFWYTRIFPMAWSRGFAARTTSSM